MAKTIGVVLARKDKCSPAIINIAQKFGMAEGEAKKLNAELKQQAKQVDGALKNAMQGATVVIGATVGAVAALTSKTMQVGDNIDKMSQKIGMSRKQYQEWDFVMSQCGGSVDNFKMGYKTLASQMEMVMKGNKDSIGYFKKLGVSVKDSTGALRNQDDIFNDVIRSLQNIKNPTERAIIGQKLLGKSFLEMKPMLNQSAESIDTLKQKANDLGLVMSDEAIDGAVQLTDTMDALKRSFGAIGLVAGTQFIPMVQNLSDELINNLPQIKTALIPVIATFANVIGFVCGHLDVIIPAVGALAGVFAGLQIITSVTGFIAAFCNPVGLAVVAISTLVAGLGIAYAKSEGFRSTVGAVISVVKLLAVGTWQAIKPIVEFGAKILMWTSPIGMVIKMLKTLAPLIDKVGGVSAVAGKVKNWADNKTEQIKENNKKPLKAHALGTAFSSGGAALVGEYGPEIVNLPQGANVVPADKTRGVLNNNNSNITVNLNVAGNVLGNHEFLNEMMNLMAMEIRKALPA